MAIAELNISRLVAPEGDERVAEFFQRIDQVNGIAERSDGFIWRYKDQPASRWEQDDSLLVVNMTVWRDLESLKAFVFKTIHKGIMARGNEWMQPATEPNFVMWNCAHEDQPDLETGFERLESLRRRGEGAFAFSWARAEDYIGLA